MFSVEDIDGTIARMRAHGAELIGEVVQYEDKYRLCYLRGPVGIIVASAGAHAVSETEMLVELAGGSAPAAEQDHR